MGQEGEKADFNQEVETTRGEMETSTKNIYKEFTG